MQTVQDLEDALPQGGSAHDGIVDDNEIVFVRDQRTVSDVIDVSGKVVPRPVFRDERTQFDVLPHHLLDAHVVIEPAHAVRHSVERHFRRIGDVGEHRMGHIAFDSRQDGFRQLLPQPLALLIDVPVRAAAEIDALERTGAQPLCRQDLLQQTLPILPHDQGLPRKEFADIRGFQVEGRLKDGPLAGQDDHLLIAVIEGGTDAPGVAHGEHLAAAGQPAHHIASVIV